MYSKDCIYLFFVIILDIQYDLVLVNLKIQMIILFEV